MNIQTCEGCIYCGVIIKHLANFGGNPEWKSCNYPLPYHAVPKASPTKLKHNCRIYTDKQPEE